jgi:hypothetical protein
MNKTILVLANSIRVRNRCIAGREATLVDSHWRYGPWIRPVSAQGEGAVPLNKSICTDGTQPAVRDVVTIALSAKQDCQHQPENYFIDTSQRWEKVAHIEPDWTSILEQPADLWLQPNVKKDRISTSFLNAASGIQSLYLIRPVNLRFIIYTEDDALRGGLHKQRRAVFDYQNCRYSLPITDPAMDRRYFTPFPALGQPPRELNPAHPDRCLLVVSLGAPFNGFHYKIVATVIEY